MKKLEKLSEIRLLENYELVNLQKDLQEKLDHEKISSLTDESYKEEFKILKRMYQISVSEIIHRFNKEFEVNIKLEK